MALDISKLRKDFAVFVVDSDVAALQSLVEDIRSTGYTETIFFPSIELALSEAARTPPHLFVFDLERFGSTAEKNLRALKEISSEIMVILVGSARESAMALELIGAGLAYDSAIRPLVNGVEIAQKLDRASLSLYLIFENEQLREHLRLSEANAVKSPPVVQSTVGFGNGAHDDRDDHSTGLSIIFDTLEMPANPPPRNLDKSLMGETIVAQAPAEQTVEMPSPPVAVAPAPDLEAFASLLQKLSETRDVEQTLQVYLDALNRTASEQLSTAAPVLYFKYVATHASLVITQTSGVPIDKLRGVGIDLKKEAPLKIPVLLREPQTNAALAEMIKQISRRDTFTAFPHMNDNEVVGVIVVLGKVDITSTEAVTLHGMFDLAWKRNLTLKEKFSIDTSDALTGALNRRTFALRLEEEMSRSRRILMPVSIIHLDIDGFSELNKRIGSQQADAVVRTIYAILKRTARVNDLIARVGPDEFAIVLPHTPARGGSVKAERLRRIVEATKFPLLDGTTPVTVSCGVSEYPTLSSDADSIVRSSQEALEHVRGTNKVCLSTVPENFQVDFVSRDTTATPPRGTRRERGGET